MSGTVAISGDYIHRVDKSCSKTHGYSTACFAFTEFNGLLYVITGSTGDGLAILDATNLSLIDSRSAPGGETYHTIETDGTTVWTMTAATGGGSGRCIRAFDASNLATEELNVARDSNVTSMRTIYANGALYDFASEVRKYDPSSGAEIWQSAGTGGTLLRQRACLVTAGYALQIHSNVSAYNIDCFNESDGSRRWRDTLLNSDGPGDQGAMATGCVVSPTGRLFVCTRRSMP